MKRIIAISITIFISSLVTAQNPLGKFEQLGTILPTPNEYRTASGAPGHLYWQQRADYDIEVSLNDNTQSIAGKETITYYNQSPNDLAYLWVQLDQNIRAKDSDTHKVTNEIIEQGKSVKSALKDYGLYKFDSRLEIKSVTDKDGKAFDYTINKTMMRIDLPVPLASGAFIKINISWSYQINDRMYTGIRSGYEYFPDDDNYLYAIGQFYPRMAVYDDVEGWQNKPFLGRGEFALEFGNFNVKITVPSDHLVAATGTLQNAKEILSPLHYDRFIQAQSSFEKPLVISTEMEAVDREKTRSTSTKTWHFKANNVRDFAFASSRKFIWEAQAVQIGNNNVMVMSFYPKEGNPLWEQEATKAIKATLETYSKYTIDYPYPVAIAVHTATIGIEYPMICFNHGRPNKYGAYSEDLKFRMIGVIIHEIGHNFFPMIINSDERQWGWMDEGMNSFLQYRTQLERYDNYPFNRGRPKDIISYMRGDQKTHRPIMTNPEQSINYGSENYIKPSAALTILRETIMGPDLFDFALKEYAQRWAFKRPKPADFFRTMEDASAVDLDWFWRGWFYTTDYVDIGIEEVKWFKSDTQNTDIENKRKRVKKGDLSATKNNVGNISGSPKELSISASQVYDLGEFRSRIDDKAIIKKFEDKNFYEVTFVNIGGLAMPLILSFEFTDGTKEKKIIPAEVWRQTEDQVTKVFIFEKEVSKIILDPDQETADVDTSDNVFPRKY